MMISGQWDGRFMVNVTSNSRDFFSLVDPDGSRRPVLLYVGGQLGDYEERKCISYGITIEAAQYFFETGKRSPALNWISDY